MSREKQIGTLSGQASTTRRNAISKTKEAQKRNTHKPQCIKINLEDRDDKIYNQLDFSANVLQNKRNTETKATNQAVPPAFATSGSGTGSEEGGGVLQSNDSNPGSEGSSGTGL